MSASNLVRFGGLAAMVGGALFVVAELLGLPTLNEEAYSETVTTTSYAIQQLLFLLGVVFVLLGLVGLYVRQSEAAGTLGLVGFLVAFAGTVLIAGFLWAGAFIAPALAGTLPPYTRRRPSPGDPAVDHRLRPRVDLVRGGYATGARLPRAAAILLIVGAVVTVLPLPFTTLVLDVAVAWLGFALFAGRGAPAEQPARVS
jgi:hypothetical protein